MSRAARGVREHAICACCRRPFTRRVADRRRGWAKCCSKSCSARLREERKPVKVDHGGDDFASLGLAFASGPEFDFNDDHDNTR